MSLSTLHRIQPEPRVTGVGVGLRSPHYRAALGGTSRVDFIELHAENFFADGGASRTLLDRLAALYPISLHCVSLGLGSASGISPAQLKILRSLVERINPVLVSDHVSFSRVTLNGHTVHASDLLPLEYSAQSLNVIADNINQVQSLLGRQILVENISAYLPLPHTMSEPEFLTRLVELTGCGLLVDINNLLVNAHNAREPNLQFAARQWLNAVPAHAVKEIHLAGFTPAASGEIAVDDHAQPVSAAGWALYRHATGRFGPVPTLIEWDNDLPSWHVLLNQVDIARQLQREVLQHEYA